MWPTTAEELVERQRALGALSPAPWAAARERAAVAACAICFGPATAAGGGDEPGEHGWAAAVLWEGAAVVQSAVVDGRVLAEYEPALLALREGALAERAVRALLAARSPELLLLLVNAGGRDHPRRCGLAVQLGAELDLPTIGVTDRPLCAQGPTPGARRGATAPLLLDGEWVASQVRTRDDVRPVVAHAGWRTTPEMAVRTVLATAARVRWPEPLRQARALARRARHLRGTA